MENSDKPSLPEVPPDDDSRTLLGGGMDHCLRTTAMYNSFEQVCLHIHKVAMPADETRITQ